MGDNKQKTLDLFKFPPCPICGKDLIAPYGGACSNGTGKYLECEDWNCGFSYQLDTHGYETIKLERNSIKIIQEYMKEKRGN